MDREAAGRMNGQDTSPDKRKFCIRCGTCCVKGGPTLHTKDKRQIEEGILAWEDLLTLRPGEMVAETVQQDGDLLALKTELVRLRGKSDYQWTCALYDAQQKACTIYADRPLECSTFNCWAPEDLAAMYEKDRLTRADIIRPHNSARDTQAPAVTNALAELIALHEQEVPYSRISSCARAFIEGDTHAQKELVDCVIWDAAFRSSFREKAGMQTDPTAFLFGRPLSRTLHQYGLEIVRAQQTKQGYALQKR